MIDWLSVLLEYPVHITAFAVYPALGIQVITNATEDNEEWEQAVGRLIISFGQIEYGVFAALKLRPALNLSDVTLEIPLAKKIDIALQLIKSRHEPEFEEVRQLLVEVKALTKLRNLVAHNPLVFAATHDSNGSVEVSRKITSLRNQGKHTSLQDLSKAADRSKEIAGTILAKVMRASAVRSRMYA